MGIPIRIVGCPKWGAAQPKAQITWCGKAQRIIFHHTAGHGLDLPGTDREDGMAYARAIQTFHMNRGWIDSGHNFLVMRTGIILQGRWRTIRAIRAGQMVVSAHCPGQNEQIGIEHEHAGQEPMTKTQRGSSARLMAWVAWHYGRRDVLPVDPHSRYFPTSCPANLAGDIPLIVRRANEILSETVDDV